MNHSITNYYATKTRSSYGRTPDIRLCPSSPRIDLIIIIPAIRPPLTEDLQHLNLQVQSDLSKLTKLWSNISPIDHADLDDPNFKQIISLRSLGSLSGDTSPYQYPV